MVTCATSVRGGETVGLEVVGVFAEFVDALFDDPTTEPCMRLGNLVDVENTRALFCFLSDVLGQGLIKWCGDGSGGGVDLQSLTTAQLERVAGRMRSAGVVAHVEPLDDEAVADEVRGTLPPGRTHGMRFRTVGGIDVASADDSLPLADYGIVVICGADAALRIWFSLL
jgi:hypothetical protein